MWAWRGERPRRCSWPWGRKPGSMLMSATGYLPKTPSCADPEIKYAPFAPVFAVIRVTE
jgi:hypothetical protein